MSREEDLKSLNGEKFHVKISFPSANEILEKRIFSTSKAFPLEISENNHNDSFLDGHLTINFETSTYTAHISNIWAVPKGCKKGPALVNELFKLIEELDRQFEEENIIIKLETIGGTLYSQHKEKGYWKFSLPFYSHMGENLPESSRYKNHLKAHFINENHKDYENNFLEFEQKELSGSFKIYID